MVASPGLNPKVNSKFLTKQKELFSQITVLLSGIARELESSEKQYMQNLDLTAKKYIQCADLLDQLDLSTLRAFCANEIQQMADYREDMQKNKQAFAAKKR